jgi:hypothetical protein
MTTPAGWYPASDGSVRMQWWDGNAWGNEFAEPQGADLEWFKARDRADNKVSPAAPEAGEKINVFNAAKIARQLRDENQRLSELVEKHGLLEVAQLDALRVTYKDQVESTKAELAAVASQVSQQEQELAQAKSQILDVRTAQGLQELGLYDFEHPAEASVALSTQLASVRSQIKNMVQQRTAVTATAGFTFNNSVSKGEKFVKDMSSILLRAYNAEAENSVKSVRAGGLTTAQARLSKVKEQIARQGTMIDLRITEAFHALRLKELELAARHLQALQTEKELERERRAELAEQRKAEVELKREQERLEKERSHYLATLASLEAVGDAEGVERMRARLAEVDRAIADVDYRAANIRAGYVYVISNIGAFGENMVKIGMTRRLEPMDRVNELGDASVPFRFDVHALFFADDAVGIEAMLHQTFADQRVNKVNFRREFFRVTPAAVLEALREHAVEVVEFNETADASEFRFSGAAAASPTP